MTRNTITMVMMAALLAVGGTMAMANEVTESDGSSLEFMREEEKLARDVYLALGESWGVPVFENIARAEQQHMDAVLGLLEANGIEDPALGSGVFANEELQRLYDELIARGEESLEEALRVGALIEEVDIEDLQQSIEATEDTDIAMVYERLLAGSYNHLRAFVSQLDRLGVDYEPVVLGEDSFDEIVEDSRGRRRGPGRGRGPGGRRS